MPERDDRMVIKADAKAMGAVTAQSTRVSKRWQASNPDKRVFNGKRFTGTSVCISYTNRDRSDAVIFRSARAERRATTRRSSSANAPKRLTCADMQAIGDQNH